MVVVTYVLETISGHFKRQSNKSIFCFSYKVKQDCSKMTFSENCQRWRYIEDITGSHSLQWIFTWTLTVVVKFVLEIISGCFKRQSNKSILFCILLQLPGETRLL